MSLKALFGDAASQLQAQAWSNPEVLKLVDVLSAILSSDAPINMDSSLKLVNNSTGPAIQVSGVGDSRALEIKMAGDMVASMGVGLGNTGLVANDLVPRPEYYISPEAINQLFSTLGQKGGLYTQTPGELQEQTYADTSQPYSGPGWVPTNTPTDVGGESGQSIGTGGRGTGYIGPPYPADIGGNANGEPLPPVSSQNYRWGGSTPVFQGRRTGTGRPGSIHTGMQALTGWGDVLGYAQHGPSGLELAINNSHYFAPKERFIIGLPASSTDNAIVRWDGSAGTWIQNSSVTIDDAGKVAGLAGYSPGNTATDGATVTFDLDLDNIHYVTLGGNRTLAVSNVDVGQRFAVRLKQDATGSRTVTWWSNISWPGGTTPTLTTTASKSDWFGFICTGSSGGNPTFDAFVLGQNY